MLISFTVGNFLSFREKTKFTMKASSVREYRDTHTQKIDEDEFVLKSAALYGPNASGKSNLLKSILFFTRFIRTSAESMKGIEGVPDNRFKLSTSAHKRPSYFMMEFYFEKNIYRYEFEFSNKIIISENLYLKKKVTELLIFKRVEDSIEINQKYDDAEKAIPFTRPNALFLSTAALLNIKWAKELIKAFEKFRYLHIRFLNSMAIAEVTGNYFDNHRYKKQIEKLLVGSNLGFEKISTETINIKPATTDSNILSHHKTLFGENKFKVIFTMHNQLDDKGNIKSQIPFELDEESDGTRKYFSLIGPIVEALAEGMVLIVDEFTSHLHPILAEQLIKLFHNKKMNKGNGQLIIATHNTYLLNEDLYRKDQIYFTEKDKFYSTKLKNLNEFKDIRQNTNFEKRYIHDRELLELPKLTFSENDFWS